MFTPATSKDFVFTSAAFSAIESDIDATEIAEPFSFTVSASVSEVSFTASTASSTLPRNCVANEPSVSVVVEGCVSMKDRWCVTVFVIYLRARNHPYLQDPLARPAEGEGCAGGTSCDARRIRVSPTKGSRQRHVKMLNFTATFASRHVTSPQHRPQHSISPRMCTCGLLQYCSFVVVVTQLYLKHMIIFHGCERLQ